MKAEELRIGNYVYPDMSYPEPVKVCPKDFINTEHLDPIPLTEEWLLKFGFETDSITFGVFINALRLRLFQIERSNSYNDNKNKFTVTVYQSGRSIEICRVRYVHQLQNLYFALTGEELTIKE